MVMWFAVMRLRTSLQGPRKDDAQPGLLGRSEMGLRLDAVIYLACRSKSGGRSSRWKCCPPMNRVLNCLKDARSSPTNHKTNTDEQQKKLWSGRRAVVLIGGRHKCLTLNGLLIQDEVMAEAPTGSGVGACSDWAIKLSRVPHAPGDQWAAPEETNTWT